MEESNTSDKQSVEQPAAVKHKNYWTFEEAEAANDIEEPKCIHGMPRNVFCGKCES